jgi:hypothetical protein
MCVDDDTDPCAFVTARGAVVLEDAAADLRDWTTGSPAATYRSAPSSMRSATTSPARPWCGWS